MTNHEHLIAGATTSTIILKSDDGGVTYTCRDGAMWVEFQIDEFADQEPGECAECGAETRAGWLCLDGADEVCAEHVHVVTL